MMPQLRASAMIIILTTLEMSFMLLELSIMLLELSIMLRENINSIGITHDDRHLWLSYFYSTGLREKGERYV